MSAVSTILELVIDSGNRSRLLYPSADAGMLSRGSFDVGGIHGHQQLLDRTGMMLLQE